MSPKRIKKIACLSILLPLCPFLLWIVLVNLSLYFGSNHTHFSLTPSKWGFSLAEEWYEMDASGKKTGAIYKTQIGPVLIQIYSPVIRDIPSVPASTPQ